MKKSKIKNRIQKYAEQREMCRVFYNYDYYYKHYFPLKISDKLFLCAEEEDFNLDGFTIRRFKDVTEVKKRRGRYRDIDIKEGVLDNLTVPDVDIKNWKTVMKSLKRLGCNIIVEHESYNEDEWIFGIGKIIKIKDKHIILKHFDSNAEWQDNLLEIPYKDITSVTFGSRYVEVFSKYLPPIDE